MSLFNEIRDLLNSFLSGETVEVEKHRRLMRFWGDKADEELLALDFRVFDEEKFTELQISHGLFEYSIRALERLGFDGPEMDEARYKAQEVEGNLKAYEK